MCPVAPGSPEDLKVDDITAEGCKLSWTPPAKDGGAPITDYIVEKCDESLGFWEPVPGVVKGNSMPVKGLEKGKKYKFRVKAQNRAGVGEPIETDRAILAKNPYGKCLLSPRNTPNNVFDNRLCCKSLALCELVYVT